MQVAKTLARYFSLIGNPLSVLMSSQHRALIDNSYAESRSKDGHYSPHEKCIVSSVSTMYVEMGRNGQLGLITAWCC